MSSEEVSDHESSAYFPFLSHGDPEQYAPQSAEAIGILKLFMDEMSADLAAQKADGDQKANRAASTRRRRSPCSRR